MVVALGNVSAVAGKWTGDSRMKALFVIVVHVISVLFSGPAIAEPPTVQSIARVYEIAAFGHRIATIDVAREQQQRDGSTVNDQTVTIAIGLEGRGSSYSISVRSCIVYDNNGLKEYSHRIEEDGQTRPVRS